MNNITLIYKPIVDLDKGLAGGKIYKKSNLNKDELLKMIEEQLESCNKIIIR